MKKLIFSLMLSLVFLTASTAQEGIERTGLDGDFFSLEGAIDIFKQSNSISDFERKLNTRDNWVNNLDLNYDGRTDYIRVEHRRQGDFHAIILQVPISRREMQDIAVIEIEKTGRRSAMLQIIGDEYLYGEEVIVEPYEGYTTSSGYGGPNADYDFRRGHVNVYHWSAIQHIFGRSYRVYASPYRWHYYPTWWSAWRPCRWDYFSPRIRVYRTHYHVVHIHRVHRVHNFYRPYRASCPSVYRRTAQVKRTTNWQPRNQRVARNSNQVDRNTNRTKTNRSSVNERPRSTTRADRNTTSSVDRPRSNTNSTRDNSTTSTKRQKSTSRGNENRGESTTRYQPTTKAKKSRTNSSSSRSSTKTAQKSQRSTKATSSRSPSSSTKSSTSRKSSSSSKASTSRKSSSSKKSSKNKRG